MEPEIELALYVVIAFILAACLYLTTAKVITKAQLWRLEVEEKTAMVERKWQDNGVYLPGPNGALPVPFELLKNPHAWQSLLELNAKGIDVFKMPNPVPQTITWSPHYSHKGDTVPPVVVDEPEMPTQWHVPTFRELIGTDAFQHNRFLLGYGLETHEPVHGTWKDIYSCAIGGQPGTGKSTATRSLLAQSAMSGCKFVIVDPHFGAGEDSLGESLQPLRRAMLCDVASNDKATIDAVRYIDSIGKARMHGDSDRSPIMLVVDEATMLFSRSAIGDELTKLVEAIAQEYRKVGVFALCLGQIWTASRTGGDSGLRDSFASALVCKMKRSQARMLVSTEVAREVEVLGIGQAILWKTSGEYARLAIPNCTQADIEVVANRVFPAKNTATNSITPVRALRERVDSVSVDVSNVENKPNFDTMAMDLSPLTTSKAKRAISMFLGGAYTSDILREVWEVSGGGDKQMKASRELQDLIRLHSLSKAI